MSAGAMMLGNGGGTGAGFAATSAKPANGNANNIFFN
jgi:hypothetical protein